MSESNRDGVMEGFDAVFGESTSTVPSDFLDLNRLCARQ